MDDNRKLWSTVGSAGTVDVADQEKVIFYNSIVQLGVAAPGSIAGTEARVAAGYVGPRPSLTNAVVRYNVTPVDGVFNFPTTLNLTLRVRYRDGDGWLVARLIQVNLETGAEVELVRFDSRAFDVYGNKNFVLEWRGASYTGELDFLNNAYYVELTLSAIEDPIRPLPYPPAVSVIQLWNYLEQ